MNIYLDIYGVFKGTASPVRDLEELMTFILDHFPGHIFWLTTYCKNGVNNARRALANVFSDDLLDRIDAEIVAADWGELKTDAIDFAEDFIWLDDILRPAERQVLLQNDVLDRQFLMDMYDPQMAQKALAEIKSRLN